MPLVPLKKKKITIPNYVGLVASPFGLAWLSCKHFFPCLTTEDFIPQNEAKGKGVRNARGLEATLSMAVKAESLRDDNGYLSLYSRVAS